MVNNKLIFKFSVISFFVVSIVGTLLHFTYDFFNNSYFIGLFCPINESVFEHLKMGLFATLFFMIFEHKYFCNNSNYILARYLSVIVEMLAIVFIFYTYTFFTKESILIIDILTFYFSIFLGSYVFYKFMLIDKVDSNLYLHVKYLFIFLILFVWFMTFYPFKIDLFEDKMNNTYGIYNEKL